MFMTKFLLKTKVSAMEFLYKRKKRFRCGNIFLRRKWICSNISWIFESELLFVVGENNEIWIIIFKCIGGGGCLKQKCIIMSEDDIFIL